MKMKILFAAAECSPLAKVGGLGDVVGSLPKALLGQGLDARIILPRYKTVNLASFVITSEFELRVPFAGKGRVVRVCQTMLPNSEVPLYLLDNEEYFGGAEVYESPTAAPGGGGEILKFLFFSGCVAAFAASSDWRPDIVHAHDWHAALIPLLIKQKRLPISSVLTIHNLAMQGLAPAEALRELGEPLLAVPSIREDLGRFQKVNLLRQGIIYSGRVNTVSPTYAGEICTPEFGEGLEGDLTARGDVSGIINGIDEAVWNETNDPFLVDHYSKFSAGLKMQNKVILQRALGLAGDPEIPLVGIVSRLTGQKGFDLLPPIEKQLTVLPMQMVALGVGEPEVVDFFTRLAGQNPKQYAVVSRFDERLAHQIYAASDIFLMPSRFEPCGLGQMIAMHYGSIPIVRATGGLADTVAALQEDLSNKDVACGFSFTEANPAELLKQLTLAVSLFKGDAVTWRSLQNNAMNSDFSWNISAKAYLNLYESVYESVAISLEAESSTVI